MRIDHRDIGPGQPCFVIAEVGVNHNGDPAMAADCIRAAARAGADAVKFQTFKAEALADADAPLAEYQTAGVDAPDQLTMLKALELPVDAYPALQRLAADLGLIFLSTPFDADSLEFLVGLGIGGLKFGSGDLDNYPLLDRATHAGLPMILSTGMSTEAEVDRTVGFLKTRDADFALMQCVSAYPAPIEAQNLRVIPALRARHGVAVGFSDHSLGNAAAAAAVALGAAVIEKHITLDRTLPGPDHSASADPDQFRTYVQTVRDAQAALGRADKAVHPLEADTRRVARRGGVAARDLKTGEVFSLQDVVQMRPASGLDGAALLERRGRTLARDVTKGRRLAPEDFV